MEESDIKAAAQSLSRWNPLGDNASQISDLDGYRTEAIDIISSLTFFKGKSTTPEIINQVLLIHF